MPWITAIGGLATGVGGILSGLASNQAASAQQQLTLAQTQISQDYLELAQNEANKQDIWLQNYASNFALPNMANYKWVYQVLNELHGTGKLPKNEQGIVENAVSNIRQAATGEAEKAETRTKEAMTTREVSKESGIYSDVLARQEEEVTSNINQLAAQKRTEYENILKTEAYGLMTSALKDPSFASNEYRNLVNLGLETYPTYNAQTGEYEWPKATGTPSGTTVPRASLLPPLGNQPGESGYAEQNWQLVTSLNPSTWQSDWHSAGGSSGFGPGIGWYYNPSTGQFRNPAGVVTGGRTGTSSTANLPVNMYNISYSNRLRSI
jgi:hypothetical protein